MTSRRAVVLLLTVSLLLGLAVGMTRAQDAQSKGVSVASSLGIAFTYQGRLMRDNRPINGTCDLRFRLFDAASGGSQVGATVTQAGTTVTNGLVSVPLDFGADAFRGDARWLEVAVRCPAGSGSYTVLSPRQPITPAPYALFSLGVPWSGITDMPAGFADGVDNDTTYSAGEGLTLSGTTFSLRESFRLPQGCANGQVAKWNGTAWTCGDDNVGVTGNFWSLTGNAGTDPATNFLGTTDSVTLTMKVSDTVALQLAPTSSTPNIIGGYSGNSVAKGVRGATIGGGGEEGFSHHISGSFSTIGGGGNNTARGFYATIAGGAGNQTNNQGATVGGGIGNTANWVEATVGGGRNNTAGGGHATVSGGKGNTASGYAATVGGGRSNEASGWYATIGGGWRNTASGSRSTVAGGEQNTASGYLATVGGGFNNQVTGDRSVIAGGVNNTASGAWAAIPGGSGNVAGGNYSFVAGRRAKANNQGCFVWGDSTNADVSCTANDRTTFRSSGGFVIYTSGNLGSGVYVAAGSGMWYSLSDRNAKENIESVDPEAVLEQLAHLPVSTWNYKTQDDAIRHMGPMAQDFYAAFGLGEDDTHIGALDADGVLMAAVQGLYQQNQAQAQEITQLKKENAMLRAQLAELADRLERLEAQLQQGK